MPHCSACLFPGQGSQEQGMGRDLAEHWPDAMELWKLAEKETNCALREIFWDGDTNAMSQTRYLQPALTVVNMSFWLFLKSYLRPVCVAGHSLGEFSALFAAGVFSHTETLKTVTLRGRLMSEAGDQVPGGMVAILKLKQEQVEKIVEDARETSQQELRIANYNSPGQYVISGEKEALALAVSKTKEIRGRAIPLAVSGAFHSPLMQEAATELEKFMNRLSWNTPAFPVILNANPCPEQDPKQIQRAVNQQMTSCVLWEQGVRSMDEMGVTSYIELGPKPLLGRMVKTILKEKSPVCINLCNLVQLKEWKTSDDKESNA